MGKKNYLELPAFSVKQPLGNFYIVKIKAVDLLSITFSEPMKYIDNSGNVKGSQRPKDEKRLKEIGIYIDSVEMAFPNSIIISANYTPNGEISKDETERWQVVQQIDGTSTIIIPEQKPLAAIIDGQHRLNAFKYVTNQERLNDLELLCSIYFDLPNSYQAFLFATINSNQKKVDRSLALEQFGYNVDDEPERSWTPEKFAVFLSRKLNTDKEKSPFYKHIKVAPLDSYKLFSDNDPSGWTVSTATIVDGICNLITSNQKRDRIVMQQKSFLTGRTRELIKDIKDISPLRNDFIALRDQSIYDIIIDYFKVVSELFWNDISKSSYINKTVGVQALFDILKTILNKEFINGSHKNIDFRNYLERASNIDFSDKFFQASGIGRSRIKNIIALSNELISRQKIKKNDLIFYENILDGINTSVEKEKWIWEENAENKIVNLLEKAEWNYDSQSVSLYLGSDYDYDNLTEISGPEELLKTLVTEAEEEFSASLPSDQEFADEQKEKFDAEDMVISYLQTYRENIKTLGWNGYFN